jgi:TonB family protein
MTIVWPVRWSAFLVILLVCVTPSPVLCQRNRVQDELNSALRGKILLLRNFYSGDDLGYDQNGQLRGEVTQGPWTLANLEITKIAVTTQGIEIVGNRMGTWYRDGKPGFVRVGKLKIHVTKPISDADTQATLHSIFSKIFVEAGEDLRPMVPDYWRSYLGGNDSKSRSAAWQATLAGEKNPIFRRSDAPAGEVTAPHVVYSPDPNYTKEAASHHTEGVSRLGVVVDATGTTSNIAILEPLGMGLDEQAVLAIKQWKFRRSLKNGQPIRVQINVEITFRCCPWPG